MTETSGIPAAGPQRSTSVLTFLIADVRGYTRFTNDHGDEAAARLAERFAALCDTVLAEHGGQVIELRGDEALAVFPSARNALRGAVALQGACKRARAEEPSLPLSVGIGLDAGEAIPVRGGYRGGALNLAARLCSIAGAGEILASDGVIHLARKTEGVAFVDRGQVTLKGLPAPIRVLQIVPDGEIPVSRPPLQSILVTHPTNLPDQPTPFIGRDEEIATIVRMVRTAQVRLVTLTGTGGTGKTRLALQVGNTLLYDFADGVFFCDLAPLTDPALVPSAIATVLGVKAEGGRAILAAVADHLASRHLLLVLDNFEHLLDAGGVVSHLLDACRELHVLVTSRMPLHLAREHEHAVSPLAIPDSAALRDAAGLSRYESVALFIQRAKAARDSFVLTEENAPAVAQICARLDGLPLAIELAAARIKLLPPPALLQRLDRSLTLLTGGARDRPGRQQTLRGTIDWSFSLLTKEEQTLFARLSVFAGGCTIEASEAVCNADGELDLFEGLASLVDKSLIRQDGEDEPRFSMLETIREYAAEKLEASGEGDAVKRRHAEFFLALARSANLTNESEGTMQHGLIIVDRDNVRAALEWARDSGESTLGLQIATALENYWATNSPLEGQHWLGDFLDRATDAPRTLRGQAIRALGGSVDIMGEFERATHLYEASLALYRELDDERGIGIISLRLAVESLRAGDLARARVLLDEALRLDRKTGFKKGEAQAVSTLGMIEAEEGNDEQAFTLLERSIELARETGFTWWQTAMLLELSELFLQRGHLPEAEDRLRQALPLLTHMQDRVNTICALALMAEVAARTGGEERAGTLWGAVEAEEARGPTGQWERERAAYAERVLAHAGPRFETARQTGRRLSLVEAVEVALSDR